MNLIDCLDFEKKPQCERILRNLLTNWIWIEFNSVSNNVNSMTVVLQQPTFQMKLIGCEMRIIEADLFE